jgi:hypothetical protein
MLANWLLSRFGVIGCVASKTWANVNMANICRILSCNTYHSESLKIQSNVMISSLCLPSKREVRHVCFCVTHILWPNDIFEKDNSACVLCCLLQPQSQNDSLLLNSWIQYCVYWSYFNVSVFVFVFIFRIPISCCQGSNLLFLRFNQNYIHNTTHYYTLLYPTITYLQYKVNNIAKSQYKNVCVCVECVC